MYLQLSVKVRQSYEEQCDDLKVKVMFGWPRKKL